MPAYSFGNRWVGIAALTEPPVPPPLHRLALSQHAAMLRRSDAHLVVLPGGERVSRDAARTALSRLGRRYAMAEQWSQSDTCYGLGRLLQNQDPPEHDWPGWLLRQVLDAAGRPRPPHASRPAAAPQSYAPRVLPYLPAPLGDIPIPAALLAALDGFGWQPGNGRFRRAWLAAAMIHVSYVPQDESVSDEITPALLGMLAAVGSAWSGLAALDLQILAEPSREVGEQSEKFARVRTVLPAAIAALLGTAGAGLFGKSQQPPGAKACETVALQICGLLVLLGDFTALGRLVARAYLEIRDSGLDTRDWRTTLDQVLAPHAPTWQVQAEGPEHVLTFQAVVTDARGVTGTGRAASKVEASRLAARDYLVRHRPEAVADKPPAGPSRPPSILPHPPRGHLPAVDALRRAFALPEDAGPLISQAMVHSSYAYENRRALAVAHQCDNRLLAHHGAFVLEALRAAEITHAVIARTVAPTNEQARIGTATDASLRPVFNALAMGSGMLRGSGESQGPLDIVKPGAVQAVCAVAWRFFGCQLLETRPAVLSAWVEGSDTSVDAYSQLEQISRILDVTVASTAAVDGSWHGAPYRATITLRRGQAAASHTGGPASAKTSAKTACAAEILARLQTASDAQSIAEAARDPLVRFLLEGLLYGGAGTGTRGMSRVVDLRLFGLAHLLGGDIERFGQWAALVERSIGPVDAHAADSVRAFYIQALAEARAGEHRALRSRARRAAREFAEAIAAGRPSWAQTALSELSACQAGIEALTDRGGQGLGQIITEWADEAPDAVDAVRLAADTRCAVALLGRETAMIRGVGRAALAASKAGNGAARVAFSERADGAALTLGIDGLDLGEALSDVLSLAVILAPRLTWEAGKDLLTIGLPVEPEGDDREVPGVISAAGLAALNAPNLALTAFAADLAAAVTLLTAAQARGDAAFVAGLLPDPVAAAGLARRAERLTEQDGAV